MENTSNRYFDILKIIGILVCVPLALALIYFGVDIVFKDCLSSTARAVISNFIVFASIIVIVSETQIKPAKMIAEALCDVRPEAELVYGRCGMQKREKNEIGIHALRLGNNPGMHQVIIATDSQTITLQHQAESRSVFADGAITAAKYIVGREPGLYNMETMLSDVLK